MPIPLCPFQGRECFPECALYAASVDKCAILVGAMLLEDLQKIGVLSYEKYLKSSGEGDDT